jgi:hypothetical protein
LRRIGVPLVVDDRSDLAVSSRRTSSRSGRPTFRSLPQALVRSSTICFASRKGDAVQHHGSESYFVIGEGLLGESVGGRDRTLASAVEAQTAPFRFSRMGPSGINRQLPDPNRKKIGNAMTAGGGGSSQIPAGFTYLGQFVDHDLTFDKTNVMLGENVSPAQLLQARSPSLDLDSLYGAGPSDPASARFYEADGIHLKMGKTTRSTASPRNRASIYRAGQVRRSRRSARRSSPIRGTTRTSRSPRRTWPLSASTIASSTRSPPRCPSVSVSPRHERSS